MQRMQAQLYTVFTEMHERRKEGKSGGKPVLSNVSELGVTPEKLIEILEQSE